MALLATSVLGQAPPGAPTAPVAPSLRVQPVLPDTYYLLPPSRSKTFVKAGYDPDDRPQAFSRGNDDGFSGLNLCESYRTVDQGHPLAVLAHFEGRAGVMGLFFRNFWSDSGGVPRFPGEDNRTRIWLDHALAHDLPLNDCFRTLQDPRGQIAPFAGPFTGCRSGGSFTHAQLTWDHSFRIGLWDDGFANASRFHRVAATIATPERELAMPDRAVWERIAQQPIAWPHAAPRRPQVATVPLPPASSGEVVLHGPATLLELTCEVPQHADWAGLWAHFTWDRAPAPQVSLPLRLLGGMVAPPYRFPFASILFANDGDRRIRIHYPMPFAVEARLRFENRNGNPVQLQVTHAVQRGPQPAPWGHFHATHDAGVTRTGETFRGPRFDGCRGVVRLLMLEDAMDSTGRIPSVLTTHLEGDLCVRINGLRGDEHTFDASETSIGRWGWYLTPADQPFASDTSFQSGIMVRGLGGPHLEGRRIMGSHLLFDPIQFTSGIDIRLEHGVQNDANADYALVTFAYVEQGAARHLIQDIDIGDLADERRNGVQFTEHGHYTRTGGFLRDQFYGTAPVTETVRHVRDQLRFRVDRPNEASGSAPVALGFLLDRLGGNATQVCQADVYVDGAWAGLLHVATHSPVFVWKEGGETEVELPRALTDGRGSFVVELRPRPGSDPLQIARARVYLYSK